MNKLPYAGAFAALALTAFAVVPTVLNAQSAPNISEVVVTKISDVASSTLFSKAPNAKMTLITANGRKIGPVPTWVDPKLAKPARTGKGGTGKTMAAEVMAGDHFKKAIITVRKGGDASSIGEALLSTKQFASLTLVVQGPQTQDAARPYLEIKMQPVFVTSYSVSGGGDRPTESLSINFTKIEFKYTAFDNQHKG